jgi:hypothetical protein
MRSDGPCADIPIAAMKPPKKKCCRSRRPCKRCPLARVATRKRKK